MYYLFPTDCSQNFSLFLRYPKASLARPLTATCNKRLFINKIINEGHYKSNNSREVCFKLKTKQNVLNCSNTNTHIIKDSARTSMY